MADDVAVGLQFRAIRRSKNMTQAQVASGAGIGRATVSRLERGLVGGLPVATLRAISRMVRMPSIVTLGWHGPEVERLVDEVHSAMVDGVLATLRPLGWEARSEHSFSFYGERGCVDVLGWFPAARTLLIVETKSRIWDLQSTLASLDRKRRLLPWIVEKDLGWRPASVGVLLVLPESSTSRHLLERRAATFDAALPARQVAVRRWLSTPTSPVNGVWFLPNDHQMSARKSARGRTARVPRHGLSA